MNNFIFENGTKFLFGGGCVKEYLTSFLAGYGPSVLLVRGIGSPFPCGGRGAGYSAPERETDDGIRNGSILPPV